MVCQCSKISDELAFKIIKKGFRVSDLPDWSLAQIVEHFIDFHEIIELENEESTQKSLRNYNRTLISMENYNGKWLVKKPCKEKTKAQKKGKILKNIVLEEEEKGFDAKECCFVAETIGEKYDIYFSFGHIPMPNV